MMTSVLSRLAYRGLFLSVTLVAPMMADEVERDTTVPQPIDVAPQNGFVEPARGHRELHGRRGWYLGVYGTYSDTGLLLTDVFLRTPAARVGLEPGDCIVAVNGHQIGILVNERLDLDVALQRHASPTGWVRLLIQDRRTQKLLNVDVQLIRARLHT